MPKITQIKRGEAETPDQIELLIASLCCIPGSFLIFSKLKIPLIKKKLKIPVRWQPALSLTFLPLDEPGEILSMPGAVLSLAGMRGEGRSGGTWSSFPLRCPGSRDGSQEPRASSTPGQLCHTRMLSELVRQPSFVDTEDRTRRGKAVCSRSHSKLEVDVILGLGPFPIQLGAAVVPVLSKTIANQGSSHLSLG